MESIWKRFEEQFAKIEDALAELNPGVTEADIESIENKLDLSFPKDFKDSYFIHDGQNGVLFLFGFFASHIAGTCSLSINFLKT